MRLCQKLRSFWHSRDGASAIEAAIIFPILIGCLFMVFGVGTFLFGTHQAQRTVEQTARDARVLSEPSQEDILALLKTNMNDAPFGVYAPNVTLLSQYGGSYAELEIIYTFKFDVPFLSMISLSGDASTQVKLREMPV